MTREVSKPSKSPVAIALAIREAIRLHRKGKPIAFPEGQKRG